MKAVSKLDQVLTLKEETEANESDDHETDTTNPNETSALTSVPQKSSAVKSTESTAGSKKSQTPANVPLKRGQKARLNKMKTKYKDQDDDDRELFRAYLAPDGANKKKLVEEKKKPSQQQKQQQQAKKKPLIITKLPNVQPDDSNLVIPNETSNENAIADADPEEEPGQNLEDELAVSRLKKSQKCFNKN